MSYEQFNQKLIFALHFYTLNPVKTLQKLQYFTNKQKHKKMSSNVLSTHIILYLPNVFRIMR